MLMDTGRICRKVRGKDAGKYCVIVEKTDKNFVVTDGKGMKRKKTNILHLEPLPRVLGIKKGADTKEIVKLLEKENLV
ncbi:MAG: 50S ribosomal protein L14e [Candidatus Altiarchaeota archaeon]|nr:50S ribosomal protein L14e [Candidatus Altiarchaeota archaeon]